MRIKSRGYLAGLLVVCVQAGYSTEARAASIDIPSIRSACPNFGASAALTVQAIDEKYGLLDSNVAINHCIGEGKGVDGTWVHLITSDYQVFQVEVFTEEVEYVQPIPNDPRCFSDSSGIVEYDPYESTIEGVKMKHCWRAWR